MVVLDTDVIVGFLRGEPAAIQTIKSYHKTHTTIITVFELLKGAYKSDNPQKRRSEVLRILQNMQIINLNTKSVDVAAFLETKQYTDGKPIGTFDTMIASMCLANKQTLITRNNKHFKQIPGLKVQSW